MLPAALNRNSIQSGYHQNYTAEHCNSSDPEKYTLFNSLFQATLEMLKFDIEVMEIEALSHMLLTGILQNVKQLAFELHFMDLLVLGPEIFRTWYLIFLELERQGFRKFKWHLNPSTPGWNVRSGRLFNGCCYELYYINLRFLSDKLRNWTSIVSQNCDNLWSIINRQRPLLLTWINFNRPTWIVVIVTWK